MNLLSDLTENDLQIALNNIKSVDSLKKTQYFTVVPIFWNMLYDKKRRPVNVANQQEAL